jgi:hypothetical protein
MSIRSGVMLLAGAVALGPAHAAAAAAAGRLYGTVETTGNVRHTGTIQWGEAHFWDDALAANHPLAGEKPKTDEREGFRFSLFGVRLFHDDDTDPVARLIVPCGEIRSVVADGPAGATIELRNGDTLKVGPVYSLHGDRDDRIDVDAAGGHHELRWSEIRRVQFVDGPAGATASDRLWGTATTRAGTFTGLVRWDDDESTLSGELDGNAQGRKWSIAFRDIASIAPDGAGAARVVLKSGKELVLIGTNDVNEQSRGLVIKTPGGGAVKIEWRALVRLDLLPLPGLPGLERYGNGRPVRGTVRMRDGTTSAGRIAWDRDESYTFETLDGDVDGIHWAIPFGEIASIRTLPGGHSEVRLRDGRQLTLEGSNDVDGSNRGIVVGTGATTILSIDDVVSVDFD